MKQFEKAIQAFQTVQLELNLTPKDDIIPYYDIIIDWLNQSYNPFCPRGEEAFPVFQEGSTKSDFRQLQKTSRALKLLQECTNVTVSKCDCSVTRWLYYLFNFWSFTAMKIAPKRKNCAKTL